MAGETALLEQRRDGAVEVVRRRPPGKQRRDEQQPSGPQESHARSLRPRAPERTPAEGVLSGGPGSAVAGAVEQTMSRTSRRHFLSRVGHGTGLLALGALFADRLGDPLALALLPPERLRFGALDPLVDVMQATPADELLAKLVALLREGTPEGDLVAAAALANARALGGTNYDGYHAFMALLPAHEMSTRMEAPLRHLPLLKVIHRSTRFIHAAGRAEDDAMAPVEGGGDGAQDSSHLVEQIRARDQSAAERSLVALAAASPAKAHEELQRVVREDANVHRVVLAWRAFDLLRLAGESQAAALLRQPLRFCINEDESRVRRNGATPPIAVVVPKLIEEHHLAGREPGKREADDAWIGALAETIVTSDGAGAAGAAAAALAEGFAPEQVGAALSLAATRLLLRDPGRAKADTNKPVGSMHGASVGVHASDSANAWRHLARAGSADNAFASLVAGAFHTGGQSQLVADHDFDRDGAACTLAEPAALLKEIDGRIRERDQVGASRAARHYGELGHDPDALFRALATFAVADDGALHHEKYFLTATEEHAAARAAHRPLYLAALTRVMASGYGFPAPGCEEARKLLTA
jgi:hypothetical protein